MDIRDDWLPGPLNHFCHRRLELETGKAPAGSSRAPNPPGKHSNFGCHTRVGDERESSMAPKVQFSGHHSCKYRAPYGTINCFLGNFSYKVCVDGGRSVFLDLWL